MKKGSKIVSYLLVLALVTALFTGFAAKTEEAHAAGNDFVVLEIVPHMSMATFGYLVGDVTKIGNNNLSSNIAKDKVRKYLQNKGYGKWNGSEWISSNYFETNILNAAKSGSYNVSVITRTPSTLSKADIESADFVVINESVPSDLQVVDGYTAKTFANVDDFSWDTVLMLFEKIAGVHGDPVPYMLDAKIQHSEKWQDVRNWNVSPDAPSDKGQYPFSYIPADQVSVLEESAPVSQLGKDSASNMGSNAGYYKLYKLLYGLDPATMYGLYFVSNDDSYGVDKQGNIIGVSCDKNTNASTFNLNGKYYAWGDHYIEPHFLTTSTRSLSNVESTMGWGQYQKFSGVIYDSGEGFFSLFPKVSTDDDEEEEETGGSGAISFEWEPNGGSWTDSGNTVCNCTFKITNTGTTSLSKWKLEADVPGVVAAVVNDWGWPKSGKVNVSGSKIIFEELSGTEFKAGETISLSGQISIKESGGGGAETENSLEHIVNVFDLFLNGNKNDYHNYRVILISDNQVASGSDFTRSLAADMVSIANANKKGLVGGLEVYCMSKYEFENIAVDLNQYYDIIYDGSTGLVGNGVSKYSGFKGKKPTDKAGILSAFTDLLTNTSDLFGVSYKVSPQEYYSAFSVKFEYQNAAPSATFDAYTDGGSLVADGYANFINSVAHPEKTLDFNLTVEGPAGHNYEVKLIVDTDFNDLFTGADKSKVLASSLNANTPFSCQEKLETFLDKDYIGAFTWKLVITDNSTKRATARIGFSAVRNASGENQVIRVLQIYPTDYKARYGSSAGIYSNPSLILPTKQEIAKAQTDRGIAISGYTSTYTDKDGNTGIYALGMHFNKVLTIDVCDRDISASNYSSAVVKAEVFDADNQGTVEKAVNRKANVLSNAALIASYMDKVKQLGIELDATRYSVYGFNKAVEAGKIVYNTATGRLGAPTGEKVNILNADNSTRYVRKKALYTTDQLNEMVGTKKKYLVCNYTGDIYGYRTSETTAVYYTFDTDGAVAATLDKTEDFDLVMIGFGSSMDYMTPDAVDMIVNYMDNEGPIIAGNGTVTDGANNTLGQAIKGRLGMTSTRTALANQFTMSSPATTMVTNDTVASHYPYEVPRYFKTAATPKQLYQLDLSSDDTVVSFTRYLSSGGDDYNKWGYSRENYYYYKKGSITFAGFGSTFTDKDFVAVGTDQKGAALTSADSISLTNRFLMDSAKKGKGDGDKAYMNCVDPDRGVYRSGGAIGGSSGEGKEDDEKADDEENTLYEFFDSVYTDYDSFGMIASTSLDLNNLLFEITSGSDPIKSEALQPSGMSATNAGTNIRWVPYEYNSAKKSSKVSITTTGNLALGLTVYDSEDLGHSKNSVDGTTNAYTFIPGHTYYIGIPIDPSGYTGLVSNRDGLGFSSDRDQFTIELTLEESGEAVEYHHLTMVRRLIYPID